MLHSFILPTARLATVSPEDFLRKAMSARSSASRARFARLGLATRAPLDRTTHAMLLRQLYLSHFEARRFRQAHEIALQAITLNVLADVLHQDAARAALARGDLDVAITFSTGMDSTRSAVVRNRVR